MNAYLVRPVISDEVVLSESFQEYALRVQEQYAPIANALFGEGVDDKCVTIETKDMAYVWKIFVRFSKPVIKCHQFLNNYPQRK